MFTNTNIKNSGVFNRTLINKNSQGKVGEVILRTDKSATFIGFGL